MYFVPMREWGGEKKDREGALHRGPRDDEEWARMMPSILKLPFPLNSFNFLEKMP
jgi:hypothetical protein